ncbi:CS1 type fimbrial major subunit, partial [Citrobacter freundii]|uniref:CS1 type fimbrial major subunit n=1 Tax=Citrobacter freundii TaxID=546 RepID=UPI0028C4C191
KFQLKTLLLAPLFFAPMMSMAAPLPTTVTSSIQVTATVDASVALLPADAAQQSLSDMHLLYNPGIGLQAATQRVKLATNEGHGVEVRLQDDLSLTNDSDAAKTVPMTVTLGGQTLSATAPVKFNTTLFSHGETQPLALVVSPTTQSADLSAGEYSGRLDIVLTQSTDS